MDIVYDVNVVLVQKPSIGCMAYVEQIPEIIASGQTMGEAKENLISELRNYESRYFSRYNIAEYKYKTSMVMSTSFY